MLKDCGFRLHMHGFPTKAVYVNDPLIIDEVDAPAKRKNCIAQAAATKKRDSAHVNLPLK